MNRVDCPQLLERAVTALKAAYARQNWLRHRGREQWLRGFETRGTNGHMAFLVSVIHRQDKKFVRSVLLYSEGDFVFRSEDASDPTDYLIDCGGMLLRGTSYL